MQALPMNCLLGSFPDRPCPIVSCRYGSHVLSDVVRRVAALWPDGGVPFLRIPFRPFVVS